jgi:hypothetical protein
MPNLPMHIYLAQQVAQELDWGPVQDNLGSCFLGSTAPDVRAMTKWDRERTHFAPLSIRESGSGTQRMFQQYPQLEDAAQQSAQTRAFLVGYVSHLTADEVWITTMFHNHFGAESPIIQSQLEGHIWDRAMQLDMDRRVLEDNDGLTHAANALPGSCDSVAVDFLESSVLQEWQDWVARFLSWDFSWQRLKRALNRMYRDNDDVQEAVDRFLLDMPNSLERAYEKVPDWDVEVFRQRVVAESIAQARQYLQGESP